MREVVKALLAHDKVTPEQLDQLVESVPEAGKLLDEYVDAVGEVLARWAAPPPAQAEAISSRTSTSTVA